MWDFRHFRRRLILIFYNYNDLLRYLQSDVEVESLRMLLQFNLFTSNLLVLLLYHFPSFLYLNTMTSDHTSKFLKANKAHQLPWATAGWNLIRHQDVFLKTNDSKTKKKHGLRIEVVRKSSAVNYNLYILDSQQSKIKNIFLLPKIYFYSMDISNTNSKQNSYHFQNLVVNNTNTVQQNFYNVHSFQFGV